MKVEDRNGPPMNADEVATYQDALLNVVTSWAVYVDKKSRHRFEEGSLPHPLKEMATLFQSQPPEQGFAGRHLELQGLRAFLFDQDITHAAALGISTPFTIPLVTDDGTVINPFLNDQYKEFERKFKEVLGFSAQDACLLCWFGVSNHYKDPMPLEQQKEVIIVEDGSSNLYGLTLYRTEEFLSEEVKELKRQKGLSRNPEVFIYQVQTPELRIIADTLSSY